MKKTALRVGILMLIGLSHAVYAENNATADITHGQNCEGMEQDNFSISGLDLNKDGVITKEEYLADIKNTAKTFNHIDANSDGKLDLEEQKEIESVYKAIHQQYKSKKTSI